MSTSENVFAWSSLILPFVAGIVVYYKLHERKKSCLQKFQNDNKLTFNDHGYTSDDVDSQHHYLTLCVSILVLMISCVMMGVKHDDAIPIMSKLFESYVERSWDAVQSSLGFVIPFAIYPIIFFWIKVMLTNTEAPDEAEQIDWKAKRDQSRLITWVVKVIIMVFVTFAVIDKIGISTGELFEITQIFSLGISWSMRDWLSGLWACFMLSFTTKIAKNYELCPGYGKFENEYKVLRTGLIYVTCCKKGEEGVEYHIPNTVLLNQGFSIKKRTAK